MSSEEPRSAEGEPQAIAARFDDVPAGTHLCFGPGREVRADDLAEVRPALQQVHDAVAGGEWATGYITYEAAPAFDASLTAHEPPMGRPLLRFELHDRPRDRCLCDAADACAASASWSADIDEAEHARQVQAVHDAIARGDTYQVNLTTRMRSRFAGDPVALHRDLMARQPAAFSAFLQDEQTAICSASPECFVTWQGDHVLSRPMKGTARRSPDPDEDAAARERLATGEKDRAENVMIVDLIRNDLARIAVPGTVDVPALLTVEEYPTIWTMTSTVTATARPGTTILEVFDAMFPCGSVTGAPKASTMRLIRELEGAPRGVYCGAIGFLRPTEHGPAGSFSVPIRTVEIDRRRGEAVYGVGGGVTWQSTAEGEWDEILTKTRILEAL